MQDWIDRVVLHYLVMLESDTRINTRGKLNNYRALLNWSNFS